MAMENTVTTAKRYRSCADILPPEKIREETDEMTFLLGANGDCMRS
jgi:hypothetical protein